MVLHLPFLATNWNLKMLVFEESGKLEYPEKNLSEQEREPTTSSTHIYTAVSRMVFGKSACDNPKRYCGWF